MALSTWQFEQILRSYDQTRQRNHALHLKRQEDIYEKIPEIKEIDQKIASQSIQTGRKILFQEDKQALRDLRIENMELSMQKVEFLYLMGTIRIIWIRFMIVRYAKIPGILTAKNANA